MDIEQLPTPSLILDRAVVTRNTERMSRRMAERGVALRPHLKTAKSVPVARLATAGHSGAITVSTLAEAAYFLENGFTDITYAVCIAPGKLETAAELIAKGADLKVIVDSREAAQAIAAWPGPSRLKVLVEIDCGDARTGLLPDDPALIDIARIIHEAPNAELRGVLTHGGHSYGAADIDGIKAIAREEREAVTAAAQRLRDAGLPCPVVSAGSTPTAVHGESYDGITEMRPGVFVFFDLDQLSRQACTRSDLALSVLGTVIAHNRHTGQIVTDTGALALSKDISANARWPETGYGAVCDARTLEPLANLHVAKVSQEHGVIPVSDPAAYDLLPIGKKVRILPNHACITAAGYRHYNVIDGTEVVDRWERVNGW
jgi:D-serine deaminase-like pyridoxal phosphate-dependent protein